MKLKAESYDTIVLEEVYNPVTFISGDKEKLSVVMRDSGFEVWYLDKTDGEYHTYEFKNGNVRRMKELNKGKKC